MSFRIGQKVVRIGNVQNCIDPRILNGFDDFSYPEVGDVVTIRTINVWPTRTLLTFREHDNSGLQKRLGDRYEPGFGAEHFRPVISRETDISVFKKLLESPPSRKAWIETTNMTIQVFRNVLAIA